MALQEWHFRRVRCGHHRARQILLLAFVSCSPATVRLIAPSLPEGAQVAVLFESGPGRIATATGLISPPASIELVDLEPDQLSSVTLLAYSSSSLEPLIAGVSLDSVRDTPVEVAELVDPALPAPAWVGSGPVVDGASEVTESSSSIELTAPWLTPCRAPKIELTASTCAAGICNPTSRVEGCRLEIDATACEAGKVVARLEPTGLSATVVSTEGFGSCSALDDRAPALASFDCELSGSICSLEVIPAVQVPELDVEELSLFPGLVAMPQFVALVGLLAIDGHLYATSRGGLVRPWSDCDMMRPASIQELGGQPLAVLRTATVTPCAAQLVADPLGRGLVMVTLDPPGLAILDSQFGELTRAPIIHPDLPPTARVTAAMVGGGRIFLRMSEHPLAAGPPLRIVAVDPLALTIDKVITLDHVDAQALLVWAFDELVVADNERDFVERYDYATMTRTSVLQLSTTVSISVRDATYHANSDKLVVAGFRSTTVFFAIDRSGAFELFSLDRFDARPGEAVAWPKDPSKLAVGTFWSEYSNNAVRLIEPRRLRALPGDIAPDTTRGRQQSHLLSDGTVLWQVYGSVGDVRRIIPL